MLFMGLVLWKDMTLLLLVILEKGIESGEWRSK